MPGTDDDVAHILAELDRVDFERADPPTDIWMGIEEAVAAERVKDPRRIGHAPDSRSISVGDGVVVDYWIDADDIVVEVGEGWADFANDNGAPELAGAPSARTLWSFFDREEVRELWRLVVQHVRANQAAARVPLRCDSPRSRRWFDLSVTPEPDGRLHFRSSLVFEELREPVALLDVDARRDAGSAPVPVCSWCGRGQLGARWLDIEELVSTGRLLEREAMPPVSYGICSGCQLDMAADVVSSDRGSAQG